MNRHVIYTISLILILGITGSVSRADVVIAEELLVDLRAEDLPYGEGVTTWPNRGTLGDFTASGAPVVEGVDGVKAVTFDGSNWFDGPTTTSGIEGAGTRSIEVWAYNPAIPGEETTVSWSHRGGPEGSNMAFNYGNDNRWGSMGHWGGDTHDMGWWKNHTPAPAVNTWWHLVYTYDGTAARVYVNGEEESVRNPIALNTHGDNIIRVAAQADDSGAGVASQFNFTGSIAAVRIHDGALSPADIQNDFRVGRLKAWNPTPPDGSFHPDTWASLSWSPGGFALSHDVYFDDNFDDVNEGTGEAFRGNQTSAYYVVGFPGFAFPDGLVPGTTYYWRIDEINQSHPDSPWRGNVWSFTVPSRKAFNPQPADGAKYISPDVTLSWSSGFNAKLHTVYFGDNFDTVSNAIGGAPTAVKTYKPGPLELEKTYYWRVDEFDSVTTHKGDVWSFTTFPIILVTDPNLVGWWQFDEGAGAAVMDWSGQGNHASLLGGPRWISGYYGEGIKLDGGDDYAVLPIGSLISSLGSATFTTWVNFSNVGGAWQRIFDFGSGTQTYIFLCPRTGSNGPMRLAITTSGAAGEFLINASSTLPSGWRHVAAAIRPGSMQLYLDGLLVASGSTSVVPSDLGTTMSNWLGRSQYAADGYFNGSLDDFRIYNYAMSADEISKTMGDDPLLAWNPHPAHKSTPDINRATPLSWSPGDGVSEHDVYFGIEAEAVENADVSDITGIYRGHQSMTTYTPPEGVEWGGGPYYWRIDQVKADGSISKGRIWSFTVADFILVDDFESYTNDDAAGQAIWQSWIDGFGVPDNGSQVGYLIPPYAEQTIVHSGAQSMPLLYANEAGVTNSEASLTLTAPRDWTQAGVAELSFWFRGVSDNAAEPLYVAISNSAGAPVIAAYNDPSAATARSWTQWRIPLQTFVDQGINLTNVDKIAMGLGSRSAMASVGGSGTMFIDDIRLYRSTPEPEPQP